MKRKRWILFGLFMIMLCCSLGAQSNCPVAVLEFKDINGQAKESVSWWIPNLLQDQLMTQGRVSIVERSRLKALVEEHQLNLTGMVNDETAAQIGQFTGARLLVAGEYQKDEKERFSLSIRLINIETGEVVQQWIDSGLKERDLEEFVGEVAEDIDQQIRYRQAILSISSLKNPYHAFQVKVEGIGDTVRVGEIYRMKIIPENECYITILNIGTSGKIHVLFPNKREPDNHVSAGEAFYTPYLKVNPPAGLERIKVLATLENIPLVDLIELENVEANFLEIGSETLGQFSKDLEMIVTPLEESNWSEKTIIFHVVE